ncbi:MAG: hypothetical protein NZ957_03810 [Thaumarchaeota archaeon]|nr:hypothetical protein [Candidatus Calditenuaceae archaeon]MDW8041784.1 hypothetical protein [Nitrososphaerota archaeon]
MEGALINFRAEKAASMSLRREAYKQSADVGMMGVLNNGLKLKPPVTMRVVDLLNLARLALFSPETQTLFWRIESSEGPVIGTLFSVPYWKNSLPFFFYARTQDELGRGSYVAYRNIDREELKLSDSNDDPKYLYAPIVDVTEPPRMLVEALEGSKSPPLDLPVLTRVTNLPSLMRLLMVASYDSHQPPILNFEANGSCVYGFLLPFYDYYEANALPVFAYVEHPRPPEAGFLRYIASDEGERTEFTEHVSDMKFFYGRVVTLTEPPFWFREEKNQKRRGRPLRAKARST